MKDANQALWFNGVPLLVLAAVYVAVAASLAVPFWRQRRGATLTDWVNLLLFPCIAIPALLIGIEVVLERRPVGGNVWSTFAGILIAAAPGLFCLARWSDRALVVTGLRRLREAEQRASLRERELEAIEAISQSLGLAGDAESVARVLLDQIAALFAVDFAGLALVDEEAREARGLLARRSGEDFDYWRHVRFDLEREPSGVASAVFEATPVTFYDVQSSPQINQRVAEAVGAKSAAFVPLLSGDRVIAVLAVASIEARRSFSTDELGPMRALAAEAALALERAQSASALEEALERERLVGAIARKLRSELDLEAVQRVAVEETARALGLQRCFIRLGGPGDPLPIAAEWDAEGVEPIGARAEALAVSNLTARRRETAAVGDILAAPELDDPSLGGREPLLQLGTRAVLATPIVAFGRMIGVFSLHRAVSGPWSAGEVALAEAVARELGLAIHTARLLHENRLRLDQQSALLKAAEVVTSELRLETVLQLLVDEMTKLLDADAADCYLYDPSRGLLRCAAVRGLDPSVVGFEFSADRGLSGKAVARAKPVVAQEYAAEADGVPHPAYEGFLHAVVAPMTWGDELRGLLGVGSRDRNRGFTDADVELLAGFASLASLALHNAETFEQRLRQARIEAGFSRIASLLAEPVSPEETHDALAQAASEALGGSFAAVLMPTARGLELVGSHGLPDDLAKLFREGIPEGAEVLGHAAREGRVVAAEAVGEDERFGERWHAIARTSGWSSLLAVPIAAPLAESGGLVGVFFSEPRSFSDEDLELGQQLARAAKGALERSELFETERRARALSQQLARTATALTAELDPTAVFEEVAEQAPALLRVDACSIAVLDGDELVVRAAVGRGADEAIEARFSAAARPTGDVVQARAPVALPDVEAAAQAGSAEPLLAAGYRAYLGVPLHGPEGESSGVLAVYAEQPRMWWQEEIEALGALAANASAALANAELYQRVALERERSLAILGNVADGIVAVDRQGRVVLWNAAAERITGVPADEATGRTLAQVLQRDLASDGGASAGERLVTIRRAGDDATLSVTEAVMRDPAGAVAGRIFAFRDVSAETIVEQMKSDFVSTVSHELRAPLTSIYGFAETLLRKDVLFDDEERATFLGYIASEAERLTAMADQLLNVARLDAGDLQVHLAATDVRPLVSEVVASAASAPTAVNAHRFEIDLPDEPLDAEADPEKLRQILVNLIDNAIKFSPGGGTVRVGAQQVGETVQLRIDDEGIGIPDAERERIFTKFYRAESIVREGLAGGTGLGLFIAQGLVDAMGGRIAVSPREGGGSSFVVELPAARRGWGTERGAAP